MSEWANQNNVIVVPYDRLGGGPDTVVKLHSWKVGDCMFIPRSDIQVSKKQREIILAQFSLLS